MITERKRRICGEVFSVNRFIWLKLAEISDCYWLF